MPIDRSNTNNGWPLMPALATTRTIKSPVTPRLAANIASTASAQTPRTVRSDAATTPRLVTAAKDDLSTPVKSFLNNNVTPRSSSRKSRVGFGSPLSNPSTPSGTPTNSRPVSTIDPTPREQSQGYDGLGINGIGGAQSANRPRSMMAANGSLSTRPGLGAVHNPELTGKDHSSMFFHASEARGPEPAPPPVKKGPVFFYADGKQAESSRTAAVPSPPLSSVGRSHTESKFYHADAIAEAKGQSPAITPPPHTTSPEPWVNGLQRSQTLRPPSPSKENIHLSHRKGASQVMRPNLPSRPSALNIIPNHTHQATAQPQVLDHDNDRLARRRSSAASSMFRQGHSKSASLSSIDSVTSLQKTPSADIPGVTPSPLSMENRMFSNSSLPETVTSARTPPRESLSALPSPTPQSPTQAANGQSALERMNALAANARRERKVLDLEISNSSLLAINRQLEKEVRKQKAEIRRFRRMSRAGRFSTELATLDIGEDSVVTSAGGLGDLSDMSEEEDPEPPPEDDVEDYSSEESVDEGAMSPNALAELDAAHRLRDEKRLQLDLSKHRELLIDSQKMNQSLKRCLNWTEELIKDAKKALAYQVRVSDVKLGGRVLSSEEHPEPEEAMESKALLSPWTPSQQGIDPMELAGSIAESERTDRDSGIDVEGSGPGAAGLHQDFLPLGSPLAETPSKPPRSVSPVGTGY